MPASSAIVRGADMHFWDFCSEPIEIRGGSQSTENRFLNRFFVERVRKMGFLIDVYRFFDILLSEVPELKFKV